MPASTFSWQTLWLSQLTGLGILLVTTLSHAQEPVLPPQGFARPTIENPSQETRTKVEALISDVLAAELIFNIDPARSKIVRTKLPILRIAVTDPTLVEVNEFGAYEFEVIGLQAGETTLTIWFSDEDGKERIIRYLVRVAANEADQQQAEIEYGKLESRINELFPNSLVQLVPVADKLIVRGQARDSQEAAQILALLGGQSVNQTGGVVGSTTVLRLPGANTLQTQSLVNLLHVPGEQQVMLKVRIAELTRSAARDLGMDFKIVGDSFSISNFIGGAGNLTAILDNGDVSLFLKAFSSNGYGKILAEPNLVTISGQPATFIAGGEFAVPTAVGVDGISAVSTSFRSFGTQLSFTPTVIDKDKIRLRVAPSFSSLNAANAVDGIPGLDVRAVTTTVDLREGQWLAIAGLIQDEQDGSRGRIPFIGDIPILGAAFGKQSTSRGETELIIMVSPELVHPLEPDQAPTLLPGMHVTDPMDLGFYGLQRIEGMPGVHHRSTVWPSHRKQIRAAKWRPQHQQSYYISGPHGFSE